MSPIGKHQRALHAAGMTRSDWVEVCESTRLFVPRKQSERPAIYRFCQDCEFQCQSHGDSFLSDRVFLSLRSRFFFRVSQFTAADASGAHTVTRRVPYCTSPDPQSAALQSLLLIPPKFLLTLAVKKSSSQRSIRAGYEQEETIDEVLIFRFPQIPATSGP